MSNLVKEKTCFKDGIDLQLTSDSYTFQLITTVCSGLLGCHKLVLTVLKINIPKDNSRQMAYRGYRKFDSLIYNN